MFHFPDCWKKEYPRGNYSNISPTIAGTFESMIFRLKPVCVCGGVFHNQHVNRLNLFGWIQFPKPASPGESFRSPGAWNFGSRSSQFSPSPGVIADGPGSLNDSLGSMRCRHA